MKTKDQLVKLGLTEVQADKVMLLESEMFNRAVAFSFKKKDGSIREAVGTLDRSRMIQPDGHMWEPKGTERMPEQDLFVKFWDCVAQAWRQFNVFNLIAVEV